MIDQDVSQKLEEVVEIWGEYVPVNGESEQYRFGGGEVSQDVPQPIFEVRSDIPHQLLRNLTKLPRRQRIAHGFSMLSGSLPLSLFKRRSLPFNKRYNHKVQPRSERQSKKTLYLNLTISGKSLWICEHQKRMCLLLQSGQLPSHLPQRQLDNHAFLSHLRLRGKTHFSQRRRSSRLRRQSRNCNSAHSPLLRAISRHPPSTNRRTPTFLMKRSGKSPALYSRQDGRGRTRPQRRSNASKRSARR